jgi:signal transduction histidine kinase
MINERVTLAQELHDGIAQDLVALGYSIDAMILESQNSSEKSSLRAIRFSITDLVEKVRTEIHALRNSTEPLLAESETVLTHELQRIFMEILRNIEKHSLASELTIQISDNGLEMHTRAKIVLALKVYLKEPKNSMGISILNPIQKGRQSA